MTLTDSDLQRAKELCEKDDWDDADIAGAALHLSQLLDLVEAQRKEIAELRTRLSRSLEDRPRADDPDWSKR